MAEALLKKMLHERGLDDHLRVTSAGVAAYARNGALVSLDARLVLRDDGIHLPAEQGATDLRSNRDLLAEADVVLAMTQEQIRMLRAGFPEAMQKHVYTLKEFAGETGDIEDPAGQDEDAFVACRDAIKACLGRVVERLAAR